MSPKRHIVFVGGGTVGHIAKLMAVMQAVHDTAAEAGIDVQCSYIGLVEDLVQPVIANSPLPFAKYSISSGKLNRFITWKHLREMGRLAKGRVQAGRLLRRLKPDCIFTNGGYVTVPVALAAASLRIPVITHETDVIPGLANRLLARSATLICTTYPIHYYSAFPFSKLRMVGQPVRQDFYEEHTGPLTLMNREIDPKLPLVTVICGSQGARHVNKLISGAWRALLAETQLVHITGSHEYADYRDMAGQLTEEEQARLWVIPFTEEVPSVFQHSTVVVSRAGGTIAELAAVGAAAILIPLPSAAQDHQRANAKVLADAHAAVVVDELGLTSVKLATDIIKLVRNEDKRQALAKAIAKFDHPKAAQAIAKLLLFP